jgi:hypothetical protein
LRSGFSSASRILILRNWTIAVCPHRFVRGVSDMVPGPNERGDVQQLARAIRWYLDWMPAVDHRPGCTRSWRRHEDKRRTDDSRRPNAGEVTTTTKVGNGVLAVSNQVIRHRSPVRECLGACFYASKTTTKTWICRQSNCVLDCSGREPVGGC